MNENSRLPTVQMWLAFSFGITFVVVLLVIAYLTPKPTEFQTFVYRVVMSLAAAGIGAIIPGFIYVNVSGWVRAGGAIACFVLVYLVNPPSLASQQLQMQSYFDLVNRGESALTAGNTILAKHLFATASELNPDAYLPYVKLGVTYFDSGDFENAKINYQAAFDRSKPTDPTLLYGVALSEEALDELDAAAKTFQSILDRIKNDREYYSDVLFSIGQIKLKMWQKTPANDELYSDSLSKFKAFLELNGRPQYWAHYHLACLYSTKAAQDAQSATGHAQELTGQATDELKTTIGEMKRAKSQKAGLHRQMLIEVLKQQVDFWPPGNPVFCPPLRALARQFDSLT